MSTCARCDQLLEAAPLGRVRCANAECAQFAVLLHPPSECARCGRQATGALLFPIPAPVLCGRCSTDTTGTFGP
jgi:hypothetical protein